jgi:hypothetical protein
MSVPFGSGVFYLACLITCAPNLREYCCKQITNISIEGFGKYELLIESMRINGKLFDKGP